MKNIAILLLLIPSILPATGQQTVKMRTRLLTSLTNVEVEKYLERNDIIFVPVGTVEVHGGLPLDCEYVGPLALAIKMAEKVDGLVLPNLTYFYPGATTVGRGTVFLTPSEGLDYLKVIARSLLRQGFKTQIYITGHGPSYAYMAPLQMEFLDETKVPILFIDQATVNSKFGKDIENMNKIMYGAYSIAGRIEDIPLSFEGMDIPQNKDTKWPGIEQNVYHMLDLNIGNAATSWYFDSPHDHGGIPQSITAAERDQWAKEGVVALERLIEAMDVNGIISNLRKHQKYIEGVVSKYGDLLPE